MVARLTERGRDPDAPSLCRLRIRFAVFGARVIRRGRGAGTVATATVATTTLAVSTSAVSVATTACAAYTNAATAHTSTSGPTTTSTPSTTTTRTIAARAENGTASTNAADDATTDPAAVPSPVAARDHQHEQLVCIQRCATKRLHQPLRLRRGGVA